MLKSAREIQQLSEEAKREALEEARLKVKLEEDQRRTIERRKNDLLEFERRAIAAAISGQGSIAIADLELDTEQLEALGFAVQKLTRRSQYENSLSQRAIAGRYQLEKRVEAMLSACPSFRFITDSEMRFRNPLMSLFESMWSIKFASAKKHASSVLASLYSTPEIDRIWIDENKDRIGDCLRIFSEVKLLESRLSEIRWENQQIPVGADSCYFIEWDLAPAISGISAVFNASLVQWFVDSWEAVAKYLAEVIQEAATDGFDSADIIMSFDNSGWWLHSTENEDGGEGINPLIIKTELSKMGYKTTVFKHNFDKQRIYFDLTPVTDDDLRSLKITECSTEEDEAEETYTLRVSWLP